MDETHERLMQEAIAWAEDCRPIKESIPKVGAIIAVGKDVIGRGRRGTGKDGDGHHAEWNALHSVSAENRARLNEATLYTTLEPCTRAVRTNELESCSELICQQRIPKVFVGMLDPNQGVTGKGLWRLQEAGVEVSLFPKKLSDQVLAQNAAFVRTQQTLGAEILSPKNGEELRTYANGGKHTVRFKCLNPPNADTQLFTYHNGLYWPQSGRFRQAADDIWEVDASFGSIGDHEIMITTANDLGKVLVNYYRKVVRLNLDRREKFKGKPDERHLGGDYPGIEMTGLPKGLRLETSVNVRVVPILTLLAAAVEPLTVKRGSSLKIQYDIDSLEDVASGIWLGASYRDLATGKLICNTKEDLAISIKCGRHKYERFLTIPADAPTGEQYLGTNVWRGPAGNGERSDRVGSRSPTKINIV